jgi:hypothetical protein
MYLQQIKDLKEEIDNKFNEIFNKLDEKAQSDDVLFLKEQMHKFAKQLELDQLKDDVSTRAKTVVVEELMVQLMLFGDALCLMT